MIQQGRHLTLFTTTKPFESHTAIIQRNALQSWRRLRPSVQIVVFGDARGTAEATAQLGVRHIPEVGRNEYGTPLVSALFEAAERLSDSPLMCYVNADIILMSDLMAAVRQVGSRNSALVVGRRVDLDMHDPWDFDHPDWEERLRVHAAGHGVLHSVTGIDYFLYSRGLWGSLPPFAIGRTAWDNWLIYRARARGARVIDASRAVTAIHQNHDYRHHPNGPMGAWGGPEVERNQKLTGGTQYGFTPMDATHVVTPWGVWPALSTAHLKRRLVTASLFYPRLAPILSPLVKMARRGSAPAPRTTL